MARWNLSRLPRKGPPLPAWASGIPSKGSKTLDVACLRWRRISEADRRRIPRRKISSPRNRSGYRWCSSPTGKVCLRRRFSFGDRERQIAKRQRDRERERASERMQYPIREKRDSQKESTVHFSNKFIFFSFCLLFLSSTRNPLLSELSWMFYVRIREKRKEKVIVSMINVDLKGKLKN